MEEKDIKEKLEYYFADGVVVGNIHCSYNLSIRNRMISSYRSCWVGYRFGFDRFLRNRMSNHYERRHRKFSIYN